MRKLEIRDNIQKGGLVGGAENERRNDISRLRRPFRRKASER